MKISRIVLALFFYSSLLQADASLQFGGATSNKTDCGSAANLDNLTRFTVMMWFRPTTITQGRGLIIKQVDTSTDGLLLAMGFTSGELTQQVNMATQNLFMDTTNAGIVVNKWHYLGWSFDVLKGAPFTALYIGSSTSPVRLLSTDGAFPGSGARSTDASQPLIIGNGNSDSLSFQGQIAGVHITSQALTQAQIEDQRFGFYPTSNTVLLIYNGFDGGVAGAVGTDRDLSGKGNNCAITGAVRSNISSGQNFRWGGPF